MFGAIIGDTVGSIYEFNNVRKKDFLLLNGHNFLTDDSIMTLAVAEILQKGIQHEREKVVDTFKRWGRAYPDRGYGGRFGAWLRSDDRKSYRSYGNGAAMRVSPCGWYGRSEEEVKELARLVTEVTHDHPEGLKGAEVVAMCVYYARIGKDKRFITEYVENYYDLFFNYNELVKTYKFNETCQKTVPQAIYCFLISKNFEDCLRTSISIGGDSDTIAAISCAIAEAYYKDIPTWLAKETVKLFPEGKDGCDPVGVIKSFFAHKRFSHTDEEIGPNTKFVVLQNDDEILKYEDAYVGTYGEEVELKLCCRFSSSYQSLATTILYHDLLALFPHGDKALQAELLENMDVEGFFKNAMEDPTCKLSDKCAYKDGFRRMDGFLDVGDEMEFMLYLGALNSTLWLLGKRERFRLFTTPKKALDYLSQKMKGSDKKTDIFRQDYI